MELLRHVNLPDLMHQQLFRFFHFHLHLFIYVPEPHLHHVIDAQGVIFRHNFDIVRCKAVHGVGMIALFKKHGKYLIQVLFIKRPAFFIGKDMQHL